MEKIKKYFTPYYIYFLWATVVAAIIVGIVRAEWSIVFVSILTLGLTLYAVYISNKIKFKIPTALLSAAILFIYATLFLGEAGNFYERFWWWDVLLHAGSSIGFGLIGVIVLIYMFRQKKVTASPFLISFFAFSFAMAIGAVWEIFEFSMDQLFGLSMQKTGLVDTMADIIVNGVGALLSAVVGYVYLTRQKKTGIMAVIDEAVKQK